MGVVVVGAGGGGGGLGPLSSCLRAAAPLYPGRSLSPIAPPAAGVGARALSIPHRHNSTDKEPWRRSFRASEGPGVRTSTAPLPHLYRASTAPLPRLSLPRLYCASTTPLPRLHRSSTAPLRRLYRTSTAPLPRLHRSSTAPLRRLYRTSTAPLQYMMAGRGRALSTPALPVPSLSLALADDPETCCCTPTENSVKWSDTHVNPPSVKERWTSPSGCHWFVFVL